jgi:hypothetical protein
MGELPPSSEEIGRSVAALYRDLHRCLWPRARDVGEQFPGRQGQLRLRGAVECVQADRRRLHRRREGGAVWRHSGEILPAGLRKPVTPDPGRLMRSRKDR